MMSVEDMIPHLYHEKQEDGSLLCAQHALNSLLRSYFTAPDLAEIARGLDATEASYDDDNTGSASTNMDDTGFFSVQVLDTALKVWGLDLVGWRGEAMRPYQDMPYTQLAFILNYQQHWYTLRRFGPASPVLAEDSGIGHWFDLNSLLPEPRWISKTFLGMVLQQAEADGYSVFVVTQTNPSAPLGLPRVDADDLATIVSESGVSGRSLSSSYPTGTSHPTAATSHDFEGLEDEDYDLQAALQASLMAGSSSDYPMMDFNPPALARSDMPLPRGSWSPMDHSSGGQTPTDTSLDPVAASTARNQQLLQRMTAEQQYAQRELWGEGHTGRQDDNDDEELRRAIAESEAMARAEGHGRSEDEEVEDDIEDHASSTVLPNFGQPALVSRGSGDRVYDDDDAELQAALKESLAQVPDGWVAPEAFQEPSLRPPAPVAAPTTINPHQPTSSTLTDMQDVESTQSDDGDSTVASSEPAEAPSQEAVSIEEMRRRRLAKFGGH
ncbi:Josephin-domain-containing protein [Armillaria borealis]|uniref:ubiquitinyl hydrolase 1 n=1 Tax=Armillaria borealis TaxID=47425 RepID=A0AA39K5D7_9AGAR|nr:Josephin-domain-containing protein [Armillaria borealis]